MITKQTELIEKPLANGKFKIRIAHHNGLSAEPPVLMMHGLTRTGRDFDTCASYLASLGRSCFCPDMIGHGGSSWSDSPNSDYVLKTYVDIVAKLVGQLEWECFDWVGTSLGGAIGMITAADKLQGRVRRLIINDIGPEIPPTALARFITPTLRRPQFRNLAEAWPYFKRCYASFGELSASEWQTLIETSVHSNENGTYDLHYDPLVISRQGLLGASQHQFNLWEHWRKLSCELLIIRGEDSDILTESILLQMLAAQPTARYVMLPNCGHAPYLNVATQLDLVATFLN